MLRLKWHCHRTVAGALYKIIVSNSCSAVFRRRTHETVSSSVPGGTAATMALTDNGRAFQARAAATGKARFTCYIPSVFITNSLHSVFFL